MNDSWHSYPSVYALGHRAVAELLDGPVIVEEKIDGSQFSFGLFEDGHRARSKGKQLELGAPEKMFARAVVFIQSLDLTRGWTYRAEWLAKPKHNALAYGRAPTNGLILFDINDGEESYLSREAKEAEARRLDLDIVPVLHTGRVADIEMFKALLDRESCLGGQKIEGVVVKNYARFGLDKKVMMGKYVSEVFKEVHAREWKAANPQASDILAFIGHKYATVARWEKAIQHLAEAGRLEGSPRDIGVLIKEVPADVEKECADAIKAELFKWAWPHICRQVTRGLPEFYKTRLLERQFGAAPEASACGEAPR